MTRSKEPAFPIFNQHGETIHDSLVGLSKREYFALHVPFSWKELSPNDCAELGLPAQPDGSNSGKWAAWRNRAEAVMRVRKADSLLAELAKDPQ